jgi:hypothetical protein
VQARRRAASIDVRVMNYRTFILILFLGLSASLMAFAQAPQQKPPAPAAAPLEEPASVLAVPKDYHYSAGGRRDPFVNPAPKPVVKAAPVIVVRPAGLKGVMVTEADIIGIVVSREPSMNLVTIQAPGGKRYFARIGDALYDGIIKSIKADSVTFALTASNVDPKSPREIERKLRSGEKK